MEQIIHCSIFVGFYCTIFGTELSLVTAYIGHCCLISALVALYWLLVPYFGCRCLIIAFSSLSHLFLWYYWLFSLMIFLSGSYSSNASIWSWNSVGIWVLITILDYGIWFYHRFVWLKLVILLRAHTMAFDILMGVSCGYILLRCLLYVSRLFQKEPSNLLLEFS